MNLTIERFNSGWVPSDDEYNGRPDGLLVMENLKLDELGVLSLTNGVVGINGGDLGQPPNAIYSKTFDDRKFRFASLPSGQVKYDGYGYWQDLFTGSSSSRCSFSSGLGHVFMFHGSQMKKFEKGGSLTNITPESPTTAPTVEEGYRGHFHFLTNDPTEFTLLTGSNLTYTTEGLEFDTAEAAGVIHKYVPTPQDSLAMDNGQRGTLGDSFMTWIFADKPENIQKVQIIVYLSDQTEPLTDYYVYSFSGSMLNKGTDTWTGISIRRWDFTKVGAEENTGWDKVYGIRFAFETSGVTHIKLIKQGAQFAGSITNPLTGKYEYIQVNVSYNGYYHAKSVRSPISDPIEVINGKIVITPVPSSDPQVNEYWIFRRDATWRDDVIPRGEPRKLDKFYRVAVRFDTSPFEDTVSDDDAILEGITYFDGLESIMNAGAEIKMATNIWNNRMVYITERDVLFSDEFDPGLFCPLWNVRLSGTGTEKNLWIKATSMNQILVGTTEDIYEITGTGALLPDGTLDIRITPVGTGFPPIHESAVVYESSVIYVAEDGVRVIGGGNYKKLSSDLDMLYYGQHRYETPPINVKLYNTGFYGLAVAKDKLYFLVEHTDGTRSVLVYEFKYNHWRRWLTSPYSIYAEEDGTLILGYGGVSNNYVRYVHPYTWTEENNPPNGVQPFRLITTYNHNGQPRNRKDVFTLKVTADSANYPVNIYLSKDGAPHQLIATVAFNGKQTKAFTISDKVPLGFRYSFRVEGYSNYFKLYEFTIEYEPLPEQLTYFHLGPTNFGTACRKRIASLPIVIDPLNGTVTMKVWLDGNLYGTQYITNTQKFTYPFYISDDRPFVDLDFTLESSTPFEFYEIAKDGFIVEKLPTPTKYLKISSLFTDGIKRRVRTIPILMDTRSGTVTAKTHIDGVLNNIMTFDSDTKRTFFYYYNNDAIGVDYELELQSETPFEFYNLGNIEVVEVFPMFKLFDQVGPIELRKLGRLIGIRVGIDPLQNTSIPYRIITDDIVYDGSITVAPNTYSTYEVPYLPKTLKGSIARITLGPTATPFHRYFIELYATLTGNDTEVQVIRL